MSGTSSYPILLAHQLLRLGRVDRVKPLALQDVWGKWYMLHLGIQAFGLLLAVAAFLVAVTQNNPIPRSLAHFQLGLAVIILAVLQPLNSLPRLTMHHVRARTIFALLLSACCRAG